MAIAVTVLCNDDDALIAWRPDDWPDAWVGFMVEKKNGKTGEVTTCASASKWDPTFAGIKFLNKIVNLRN